MAAGAVAWFLAPFMGTIAYVLFSGLEMAVARRKHDESPPERAR